MLCPVLCPGTLGAVDGGCAVATMIAVMAAVTSTKISVIVTRSHDRNRPACAGGRRIWYPPVDMNLSPNAKFALMRLINRTKPLLKWSAHFER